MTDKENLQLINLLRKCEPGNLSPDVFEEIARLAVYPAVELIPLRRRGDRTEVLLYERPQDDIRWPSMLHTPGTILRPTDVAISDATSRLYNDELIGLSTNEPISIGYHMSLNDRGRCILLEYIVEVKTENPEVGVFYDVDKLPDSLIVDQIESIRRAVTIFNKRIWDNSINRRIEDKL